MLDCKNWVFFSQKLNLHKDVVIPYSLYSATIIHRLVNLFHVNGGCELPFKAILIFFFPSLQVCYTMLLNYIMTLCYIVLNCVISFLCTFIQSNIEKCIL